MFFIYLKQSVQKGEAWIVMKHVILIYRSYENYQAVDFIKQDLEEVFEDNVLFTNAFLKDMDEDTVLQADAFFVVDEYLYHEVASHVKDFRRLLVLNRVPDRSALTKLSQIPVNANVLVVNDSYYSSQSTINSFYEVGISHINMIPFDENLTHTGIYDHLQIAVTPAEPHLVPPNIKEIIDIGYRKVSFDSMFKMMRLLNLDVEAINRNLFRHIQDAVEPNNVFHSNYIYSYLKEEMLNHVVNSSKTGMVLTDYHNQVIYANDRALQIFHANRYDDMRLKEIIDPSVLEEPESIQTALVLFDVHYSFYKYPLMLVDEIVGYYLSFQEENDVTGPRQINRQKGHTAKYHFQDIIHGSPEMEHVIRTARQIAKTDHTILIQGESGTGKELLAQSIHNASFRSNAPFIAVNCAALPESLLESELFGYDPGAFTGADSNGKVGLFEQANHGTIFLDEIGDISPRVQMLLLRAIQEKQIMRVGGNRLIDIDIRLITATNRDLEAAVTAGTFRNDLFFRLNVLPLTLPPLRKRKEDIPSLMKFFLGRAYRSLTASDKQVLMNYDWPGNVRELENAAIYFSTLSFLPDYLRGQGPSLAVPVPEKTDDLTLKSCILSVISANSSASHGIGRVAVLQILKGRGIPISDIELRRQFAQLKAQELIQVSTGRNGTCITENGLHFLHEHPYPPVQTAPQGT